MDGIAAAFGHFAEYREPFLHQRALAGFLEGGNPQ
jgi:hypothetical protein